MDDKELLELAAKAAWIQRASFDGRDVGYYAHGKIGSWNPLTDHGDALRLAMSLGMMVDIRLSPSANQRGRTVVVPDRLSSKVYFEDHGNVYIATCRAIVLAAADIGMTMQ